MKRGEESELSKCLISFYMEKEYTGVHILSFITTGAEKYLNIFINQHLSAFKVLKYSTYLQYQYLRDLNLKTKFSQDFFLKFEIFFNLKNEQIVPVTTVPTA